MKNYFTPKCITRLIGISYRQVQYWDKTKFIGPSFRRRGKYRLYTVSDVMRLKVAQTLHKGNVSIQKLRGLMRDFTALLPQISVPLWDIEIVIDAIESRIWIYSGMFVTNALPDPADGFFHISMMHLRGEIDAAWPDPALMDVLGAEDAA